MQKNLITVLFVLFALNLAAQTLSTGIDKQNMNLQAKPGIDFFEYSAGGWMKNHPLTDEYSMYGQFNDLNELARKQIREIITEQSSSNEHKSAEAELIGTLYNMVMDSIKRNQDGAKPVLPYIKMISEVQNIKEYQIVVANLYRKGLSCTMFDVYPSSDFKDATQNILWISQSGLGLGNKDYYVKNDSATQKVLQAYKLYNEKLFNLIGDNNAKQKAEIVLQIETKIANASRSREQLRDVEGNYNVITYNKLVNTYPLIDWGNTMLGMSIPAVENVNLSQPEFFDLINQLYQETPLEDLKTYAIAALLRDASKILDDQFSDANFKLSQVMYGVKQKEPRWKTAVSVVNSQLGQVVGKLYVEKYFPESSKKRMLQLVNNLQDALRERIQNLTWMGQATKQKAIDKLNNFYVKIGYPDTWRDFSQLKLDSNKSLLDNYLTVNQFNWMYIVDKRVNKPVDNTEWHMTPQTVNAYYNPTTNEICFPAGILQPPFFNPNADDACNYGAIGVVIGHEMSHGFDDQGCQFDKYGNLNNWWTEEDKKSFENRTKTLVEHFSKQEVLPGVFINGAMCLGENIGDNGGLNIAYQAFKNALKTNPLQTIDGFSPEQRFFLSYGLIWANNIREEALRQRITNDVHSPGKWRVNAALPMIDAWYEAFKITKKDKLYVPYNKRAHIW